MKVVVLNLNYEGRYGGSIDETVLLPEAANGFLFSFREGHYSEEVILNEIEGKHSVSYAGLDIEIIDLKETSRAKINQLIKDSGYIEHLESYLESNAIETYQGVQDDDEIYIKEYNEKVESLVDEWVLTEDDTNGQLVFEIADSLHRKLELDYSTKEISVNSADYEKAIKLLKDNGIEIA